MAASMKLSSRTWTLRFKHHRTTVLLYVDPLQKLSLVRAELLAAVSQSHPDGHMNGYDIPQNPDDVLLARPVDINDLDAGWEPIERQNDADEDVFEDNGKGKGKAAASGKGSKSKGANSMQDCPQGAGLRDGGVVAFKFRSEAQTGDDHDEGVEDMEKLEGETLVGDQPRGEWDVVVPSMEETYGEDEDQQDDIEIPLPKH